MCIAGALQAQEAPVQLDAVVVTGTNIRGAEPVGNTVQVISAEQIRDSGKATLGDFLRELPANFAGGVGMSDNVQGGQDASVAGSNMTGGQGVNLRGLGALSTLVLINGRRAAAAGQYGDFVDISSIPANAISHIEVLLDGASAVYGSDAVGGVVNIITKRSDDGAHTNVRVGTTTQGGGHQYQVGQTWGTQWDRGGMIVGYEFNRQDNVLASDRDIYNGGDFSDRGGVNWRKANARAGRAANLFSGVPAANGNVIWTVPGGAGTGLTAGDLVAVTDGVGNTYDAWERVDIVPQMDRHSVFFGFEQDVGEATSLYGDLRYSRRRGSYNQGHQALYGMLAPTSPYYIPGVANNFGVLLGDRPLQREVGVDSYAAVIGASFELGGSWRGEATASYSREKQFRNSDVQRNANIYDYLPAPNGGQVQAPTAIACSLMGLTPGNLPANASAQQRYCAGLNYTAFNPWSTEPLSEQVRSQLIGYENLDFTSWLAQASFKVDGDLFDIAGGSVKLAAGADWRRENIGGALDFNWRSTSDQHTAFGTTERDVAALFTELAIPLVGKNNQNALAKKFDISVAGRYERGRGLGDFSTFNPKVGFDWKPTDALTLRGSWGTSFHAPPMRYAYNGVQPISGGNGAFMRADLYNAPCDTTMIPLNGVAGTPGGAGNCTFTAIVVSGGAGPTLKPEESKTWTLGFDYAPEWAPGLSIGASYFNLKIDDRIVRIQAGTLGSILAQLFSTGSTPYAGSLELNPGQDRVRDLIENDPRYLGQLGAGPVQGPSDVAMIINATQLNLASLKMNGVDFNLGYGWDTDRAGTFDLFARGTWLNSYEVQSAPGAAYVDQLGKYNAGGNPVRLRSQQGLRWSQGDLRASLTANYVHRYECVDGCYVPNAQSLPVLSSAPVKIGSWTTFDLSVDYDLTRLGGFFDGARVNFTAVNATDRKPPFVDGGTAANDAMADPYDPANATVLGRTLVLSFDKRW
ncbi:TonB-dependent receptor plug domain-containing protein [Stenotrophomonas mori]|uniref:TonB-dependent receptor n=1 Tax=Stenotrophomonas mori TaxID=2871096 RepID=A0ABT0SK93_9GAMM|nr:TonB-dependent receptor [Stenotrophomonas mori]MCL7715754.1 TonB-dependent receptor [Stenotrophomonas mori]